LIASAPVVAVAAPALLPDTVWARRQAKRTYFVLNPEYGTGKACVSKHGKKPHGCRGCKACHTHAANKLFATAKAADGNRAHTGCKCRVVKGGTLGADAWRDLFGGSKHPKTQVADRRKKRVKKILAREAKKPARGR
jgi:hypothetical protein